jgi:hypothetical protein
MTQSKDEQLDPDGYDEDDEFDRMQDLLSACISDFAEEHDLPIGALSPLLLQFAVTTRMTDYVLSVEKPSVSGLKLDLDRLKRDVEDLVRDSKRHADDFIAHSKDALQEAQAELEAEAEPEAEDQKATRKP